MFLISLSILELKYIAISMAMRNLLPMRELLNEIIGKMKRRHNKTTTVCGTVFEDNKGSLKLVSVQVSTLEPNILQMCINSLGSKWVMVHISRSRW